MKTETIDALMSAVESSTKASANLLTEVIERNRIIKTLTSQVESLYKENKSLLARNLDNRERIESYQKDHENFTSRLQAQSDTIKGFQEEVAILNALLAGYRKRDDEREKEKEKSKDEPNF